MCAIVLSYPDLLIKVKYETPALHHQKIIMRSQKRKRQVLKFPVFFLHCLSERNISIPGFAAIVFRRLIKLYHLVVSHQDKFVELV